MRNGFTLIELSIVLVIIGLLIGGILIGQSLINNAKLQNITQASQQYSIAFQQFKNRFKALPGDYYPANDLLGPLYRCSKFVSYLAPNGVIGNSSAGLEQVCGFIQMERAGTLHEGYNINSGFSHPNYGIPSEYIGNQLPKLADNRTFLPTSRDTNFQIDIKTQQPRASCRNYFAIGRYNTDYPLPEISMGAGALTAVDAMAIDSKLDDGIRYSGKVLSMTANNYSQSINPEKCQISGRSISSLNDYKTDDPDESCITYICIEAY